jgi:hypothetical protein
MVASNPLTKINDFRVGPARSQDVQESLSGRLCSRFPLASAFLRFGDLGRRHAPGDKVSKSRRTFSALRRRQAKPHV